jgi:hypothetical protein
VRCTVQVYIGDTKYSTSKNSFRKAEISWGPVGLLGAYLPTVHPVQYCIVITSTFFSNYRRYIRCPWELRRQMDPMCDCHPTCRRCRPCPGISFSGRAILEYEPLVGTALSTEFVLRLLTIGLCNLISHGKARTWKEEALPRGDRLRGRRVIAKRRASEVLEGPIGKAGWMERSVAAPSRAPTHTMPPCPLSTFRPLA